MSCKYLRHRLHRKIKLSLFKSMIANTNYTFHFIESGCSFTFYNRASRIRSFAYQNIAFNSSRKNSSWDFLTKPLNSVDSLFNLIFSEWCMTFSNQAWRFEWLTYLKVPSNWSFLNDAWDFQNYAKKTSSRPIKSYRKFDASIINSKPTMKIPSRRIQNDRSIPLNLNDE